jgi:transposase
VDLISFDNIIPMPLPPYAPELNPVEQLWLNIKQRNELNNDFHRRRTDFEL